MIILVMSHVARTTEPHSHCRVCGLRLAGCRVTSSIHSAELYKSQDGDHSLLSRFIHAFVNRFHSSKSKALIR